MKNTALLLIALWLSGVCCVREVEIDLPAQPVKIVALSHFTPGQPFRVEVSLSQALTDAGDPTIPFNADVAIALEGKFLDKLFRVTGDGPRIYWESRDLVSPESEYLLSVRIGGLEPAEALSYAPAPILLDRVQIDTPNMRLIELTGGKVAMRVPLKIFVANLPLEKRYFAFNLAQEVATYPVIDDEIRLDLPPDEYTYESTKFLADGRTLALVYDTPEKVVLVNENFWSDDKNYLALDALIPFDPADQRPIHLFVEWRTLSEAFYRYHLSVARQGNNLPLNDPDALYNNVVGGYGNFSGYSVDMDTISLPYPF